MPQQQQPAPSHLDHPEVRELLWSMQARIAHLEEKEHERLSAMAIIQSVTDQMHQMRGQTERDMAALNRDTKSLWEEAAHDHNRIEYLFNAFAAHVTLFDDLKTNNDQERWKRNSLHDLIDRLERDHQSERAIAHEAMSRIHMRLGDSAKSAIQAERALAHEQQKSNILGDAIRDVTEFQRVDRQKMSDLEGEVQELKKQISRLHAMRQSGDYATSDIWKSPPAGAAPQLPENLELPATKPDSTLAGSVGGLGSSFVRGPTPPTLQVESVTPTSIAGRSSVTVPAGDVFSRTVQPVPRVPPSKPIEPTRSEIAASSGTRQSASTSSTEAAIPPSNRPSDRSTHDNSRRACPDIASQLAAKPSGSTGPESAPLPGVTIDVDQLVYEHFKSRKPPNPKQPIAAPWGQSQIASSASGKPTIPYSKQRGIIRLQEPTRAVKRIYRIQQHNLRQMNRPVEPRSDNRDTTPISVPGESHEAKLSPQEVFAPAVKVSTPSVQRPSVPTMSVTVVPLRPTADRPAVLPEPLVLKASEVKTASVPDPQEPAQIIVAKVETTANVVSQSDVQIQPIVESAKPVSATNNASSPAETAASPQKAMNLSEQSTTAAIIKPSLVRVTVFNALKHPASMHQGIDQAPERPERAIKPEIAPTVPTSTSKTISETPVLIRSSHDVADTPESPSVQTPYTGYKWKGKWKGKGKGQASQAFRRTALGTPTRSGYNNQVGPAPAKGPTPKRPSVASAMEAIPPKRSILGKGRFETLMSGDENASVTSEDEEPDTVVDRAKLPESTTPTNKTKSQSAVIKPPKESCEPDEIDKKLPIAAVEDPVPNAAEEPEKPSELSIMDESEGKLPIAALEQLVPDVTEEPEKPAEASIVDESDGKLPIVGLEEPVLDAPEDSEEPSELSIVDMPTTVVESSSPTPDDDARPESEAPEADNETLPCDDVNVDAAKDSTLGAKARKSAKNAAKKKKQKAQKKIEQKTTPEHDTIFGLPKGYVPRLDDEFIDTVLNLHVGEDVEDADTTYDPDAIQRMAALDDRTLKLINDVSMTRLRLATSKNPKDKTERARLARFFNIMFKHPVVYDPPTRAISTILPPMEEGLIGLGLGGNGLGAAKPGSITDRLNKLSLAGPLSSVPMTRTSDPFAARRPPSDFVSFASKFGASLAGTDKAQTSASQTNPTAAGHLTPMAPESRDETTLKSGFLQTEAGLSGAAPSTPSVTIKPPTYEESISATPDLLAKYAHAPMTRRFQRTPSPSIAKATPPSTSGSGAVATSSPGGSPWSSLLPFASSLSQGPTLPAYKQTKEEQITRVSEAEEERKRTAAKTLLYMRLVPMSKSTESPIDAAGGSSSSKISSPGGEVPDCQSPQTKEDMVDESNTSGDLVVTDPSSIPLPVSSDDEDNGTRPSIQEMAEHVQTRNRDRSRAHDRDQETAFDLFSPRTDLLNQFVAVSAVINPQLVEGPTCPGDTTTSKVEAVDGSTAIDSEAGGGENKVETGSKD